MKISMGVVVMCIAIVMLASNCCIGQEASAAPVQDPDPAPAATAPADPAPAPVTPKQPATPAPASSQQPQQFVYPATVDSMMRLWGEVYEICGKAGVQPWDVHLDQIADDGVVLKVQDKFFVSFVKAASEQIGDPLVRLSKLGDQMNANASFDYEMPWSIDHSTVLDDQLKALGANGIQVQTKHYQVIAICAGKPPISDVLTLFGGAPVAVTPTTTPAPSTTVPDPAPAPAPTGGVVTP